MGFTLTLNGNKSTLNASFFPPITLNEEYECGLVDLQTYNSIPNIDKNNFRFVIGDQLVEIPTGSYEIDDIYNYITTVLKRSAPNINLEMKANNNTLKCEIKSNRMIYFNHQRTIGPLLGFSSTVLYPDMLHSSDLPVEINKVNSIRVDCNIINGSFFNDKATHTLHEFSPTVPPGYKINEVPRTVIYLPVTSQEIRSITIRLLDQNGDLINFQGENITVRLHLRPKHAGLH